MLRAVRILRKSQIQQRFLALTSILDDSSQQFLTTVTECSQKGFVINKMVVKKPVLLLPRNFLIWNTNTFEEIDVNSLSLFTYLYPTLELLIVGCGPSSRTRLPQDVREHFQMRGIVIDQMDSMNAVQTFNILVSEGRNVGAAVLPLARAPEDFDPTIFNN